MADLTFPYFHAYNGAGANGSPGAFTLLNYAWADSAVANSTNAALCGLSEALGGRAIGLLGIAQEGGDPVFTIPSKQASTASCGVMGVSYAGSGLGVGSGVGVYGNSQGFDGIVGETQSNTHAGVTGRNLTNGANGGVGIYGTGGQFAGKFDGPVLVNELLSPMTPTSGFSIYASCTGFDAIVGETQSNVHAGVTGRNKTNGGSGIYGTGGQYAGRFDGDVLVNGTANVTVDIILVNSDCAEDFEVGLTAEIEPGTVLVLDDLGVLHPSQQAYDTRVAGVMSGAGELKPGIILGRHETNTRRVPVALVGKVYCKVDAQCGPITVGDLLTTSSIPGHAMKAQDSIKAFGAVIGKALRPLRAGQGLIPILVALQ